LNLSTGTCTEPLNMEWANDYLGSARPRHQILVEEVDPKVDPLAPRTK
jgi:aldehyde:ferredoxin oxidoreductase